MKKEISEVAVIGSGIMGSGIAQIFAQSGYNVTIYDKDQASLTISMDRITRNIKKWCKKNGVDEEEALLKNIRKAGSIVGIQQADFIIEAVTEKLEVKQAVFLQVEEVVSDQAIIASNTSGISISAIAESCQNKERVIGTHFFNPPYRMPLVEVIQGDRTSSQTVETAQELMESIGKTSVLAADVPGFIVNRIITPMLNQAMLTYEQGIATASDIDSAIKLAMGHPMGPLELADYIGLDTILFFMEDVYQKTGDQMYKPGVILKQLVEEGKLGFKSGAGFYHYKEEGEKVEKKKQIF